eukprot:768339-Hanusia_phi.AAC.2
MRKRQTWQATCSSTCSSIWILMKKGGESKKLYNQDEMKEGWRYLQMCRHYGMSHAYQGFLFNAMECSDLSHKRAGTSE